MKLVRDRGVTVAQASRDLDVHENVLRKWERDREADPEGAFPGQDQMKPEQQEIERLRREVTKLKAEQDIQKRPRPTSRRTMRDVRICREAPGQMARGMDVRCVRCVGEWVSRLVVEVAKRKGEE